MQTIGYRFERLSSENIHSLVQLYRQVFKKEVTLEFILRKYATKNLGVEYVGYIAFTSENFPVAFYGVIPCLMQLESNEVLAAQSADTMTHESHRNQGLFIHLAQKTYELAKEHNIKFIFGVPNQDSYHGLVKLNWQFMPQKLKLFKVRASWLPCAKLCFKSKVLAIIYLRITKLFLYHKIAEPSLLTIKNHYGLKHDDSFFEYKKYNQAFFYQLGEIGLWIKIDGILKIGYVQLNENADNYKFKKKIRKMAILLGCSEVSFITYKDSALYNWLTPVIQSVDSLPVGFYNLTNEKFPFDLIGFEYCDIDIF